MADPTLEELTKTVEALTAKVASAMEDKKEDAKTATLKTAILSAMEHMDDTKKASYRATVMSGSDDEMKKAMESIPEKKDGKTANEDEEKKDAMSEREKELTAKVAALEAAQTASTITSFVASVKDRISEENQKALTAAMQAYKGDVTDLTEFGSALVAAIEVKAPATNQWLDNKPAAKFAFVGKSSAPSGRTMEDIINGGGMA